MIPEEVELNLGLKKRVSFVKLDSIEKGLILMWAFTLYFLYKWDRFRYITWWVILDWCSSSVTSSRTKVLSILLHHSQSVWDISQTTKQQHLQTHTSSFKAKARGKKKGFYPGSHIFFKSKRKMFSISTPNRFLLTHHWTERIAWLSLIQHLTKKEWEYHEWIRWIMIHSFIGPLVFKNNRNKKELFNPRTTGKVASLGN